MMKETQQIMGMPVTIMWTDDLQDSAIIERAFDRFRDIDATYSPFVATSEVSKINREELQEHAYSNEMRHIIALAEQTTRETDGYFNVWHNGVFDPSGIVKGWAIQEAAKLLATETDNFYVEVGGDIEVAGQSTAKNPWTIGVRNPFNRMENIAIVQLEKGGIATSGTAIRGHHIYNPLNDQYRLDDIVSLTVIAANIIDADRMATAAFAMGAVGIQFIESLPGYEGYMVDREWRVTMTTHWQDYEVRAT